MPSDRAKIEAAKSYLRRKYTGDLAGLKLYADSVFTAATDAVEITGISSEGGNTTGQIVFEKSLLLIMVEELIREQEATAAGTGGGSRAVFSDFSRHCIAT